MALRNRPNEALEATGHSCTLFGRREFVPCGSRFSFGVRRTTRITGRSPRLGKEVVGEDLEAMTREQLIAEARRLRTGIRAHRDSTGHALCWHHPELQGLLPEKTDPLPTVPTWPEFLRGCLRYRQSLDEQLPDAPRSDAPYQP
jgi:hypothetical protein